jgi:hypothetical protein
VLTSKAAELAVGEVAGLFDMALGWSHPLLVPVPVADSTVACLAEHRPALANVGSSVRAADGPLGTARVGVVLYGRIGFAVAAGNWLLVHH